MSLEQMFLQLGICGAMLLVWFRIEGKRIERNASTEDRKTEAMAQGFATLASRVESHHTADLQSHQELGEAVARIEGKLDITRRATPPQGVREIVRRTDGR
jgi:hypothetical protein